MSKGMVTVSRHTLMVYLGAIDGDWVEAGNDLRDALAATWCPDIDAVVKNSTRYQFIADSACDVSFYVANTDSGDGDTAPGPRVELTPDQYPVEMFGTGKAKLDFAVDALMATKEVATPSTDTEDVSRHGGGQT